MRLTEVFLWTSLENYWTHLDQPRLITHEKIHRDAEPRFGRISSRKRKTSFSRKSQIPAHLAPPIFGRRTRHSLAINWFSYRMRPGASRFEVSSRSWRTNIVRSQCISLRTNPQRPSSDPQFGMLRLQEIRPIPPKRCVTCFLRN